MKIRAPFTPDPIQVLLGQWIHSGIMRFTTPAAFHTAKHKHVIIPTVAPTEARQTAEHLATVIARQHVAKGTATDPAAEAARILDSWGASTPDQSLVGVAPTSKTVKTPLTKKRKTRKLKNPTDHPRTADQWLQQAARILTERRIAKGENINPDDAYTRSLLELRTGYFNPRHWRACDVTGTDHLSNVPTSGPDPKHRSYAYPDPANVRTLATYADGAPDSGPPRYNGNSAAGEFRDHLLVWSRTRYDLINDITPGTPEPTFIEISGRIRAFASRRGSRPMLSYICKTWLTADGSSLLDTVAPPTVKPWSFYYRYKVPDTPPPYYASEDIKHAIRTMCQPAHMEPAGPLKKAVVLLAPRPMYGRGFNNNTDVTTQLFADARIWQIDLNQPDPNPNHVFAYTINNTLEVLHDYPISGGTSSDITTVNAYTWTATAVAVLLDQSFVWQPRDKTRALAAIGDPWAGALGWLASAADEEIHPAAHAVSPPLPADGVSYLGWLASVHLDATDGQTHHGFVYDEQSGAAVPMSAADFTLDAFGNVALTNATIDQFARPGVSLFVNGVLYRSIPP